jgi:hypothetical protein
MPLILILILSMPGMIMRMVFNPMPSSMGFSDLLMVRFIMSRDMGRVIMNRDAVFLQDLPVSCMLRI